jgi:hypothetical protein
MIQSLESKKISAFNKLGRLGLFFSGLVAFPEPGNHPSRKKYR